MKTALLALAMLPALLASAAAGPAAAQEPFTFVVTADMRGFAGPGAYDTPTYFRGAAAAIDRQGAGLFMISPGDIDPPDGVEWTIRQYISPAYTWYPIVGNHEADTDSDMIWLRGYDYGAVTPGPAGCPETTYSFDRENAHFVVLNEYCDVGGDTVTTGDIPDHLYNWLAADLALTRQPHIFVFGHEPAYPQPDADNGRLRHELDSLNQYPANRDRFWNLLRDAGVAAYICGHTHNYSAVQIDGVWQLDVGHARGAGDTGAASTYVVIEVAGSAVSYTACRDTHDGVIYDYGDIVHGGVLASAPGAADLGPAWDAATACPPQMHELFLPFVRAGGN